MDPKRLDNCLELLIKTNRLPEAAFLARTYLPSQVSSLSKVNQKAAESLADPTEYENLFPGLREAFIAEQYLRETSLGETRPASDYPLVTPNEERNVLEEASGYEPKGVFPTPTQVKDADEASEDEGVLAPVVAAVSASVAAAVSPTEAKLSQTVEKEEEKPTGAATADQKVIDELEDDLDNMELDDIDTTDVNLDDDFSDD
ncbi:coatomer subunit beta'-like [Triplophysa rosa]|uniref:coatomer subunit beta'-like n=1 Tax=Triplophysa rosa TaxID=992332 RepID=UPI0025462947|nr:coatomer subunit beta'-like [Triplophysa rosa]